MPRPSGSWWGDVQVAPKRNEQRELDAVAVDNDGTVIAAGSCKWTNTPLDYNEEALLTELRNSLSCPAPRRCIAHYFFSRFRRASASPTTNRSPATSSAVAGARTNHSRVRGEHTPRPASSHGTPGSRHAARTETSTEPRSPGASNARPPRAPRRPRPSTPRSSELHGKWTVSASAAPSKGYGGCSAAATANSAFGSFARRDASRHPGRVRVEPDHERLRLRSRGGQHVAAVTGAEVDRDAAIAAPPASANQPTSTSWSLRPRITRSMI